MYSRATAPSNIISELDPLLHPAGCSAERHPQEVLSPSDPDELHQVCLPSPGTWETYIAVADLSAKFRLPTPAHRSDLIDDSARSREQQLYAFISATVAVAGPLFGSYYTLCGIFGGNAGEVLAGIGIVASTRHVSVALWRRAASIYMSRLALALRDSGATNLGVEQTNLEDER